MAILLTKADVEGLLDMQTTIDTLEAAFAELSAGGTIMPQRTPIKVEDAPGLALFMPAFLPGMQALGAKVVSVYGGNPAKGLPAVLGTIILLDAETGEPLCVMEGGYLTAMRTGGVSGVASKFLARDDARVHGLFGSGVQARAQAWAVATACQLELCLVSSLEPAEQVEAFCKEMTELTGVETKPSPSPEATVGAAQVLTLATSAKDPVLNGVWLQHGVHINGIGSHAPGMRELDTLSVKRSKIICDLTSACQAEAGDFMIPAEAGEWSWDAVHADLGEVINGSKPGREDGGEITLFKSVGLAIQDLSVAWRVYNLAKEQGKGTEFNFR